VFDDGNGPALVAGGEFGEAGGTAASFVATWKASVWSGLGDGLDGGVHALSICHDTGWPAVYAGGSFTVADGVQLNGIARWNGSGWEALADGLTDGETSVDALAEFDDGSGQALYAGGSFGGDVPTAIARWNGSSWSALGAGVPLGVVYALAVHDDGSGPALYAGGSFFNAGGVLAADRIARWDGASWTALGSGMNDYVHALTTYDDGGGAALYAAGKFTSAGGVAANGIARWDGSSWTAVGGGMNAFTTVHALAVHDDGTGPALHAGGNFTVAGGVPASRIARWDGTSWTAVGGGMNAASTVYTLTVHDDGTGPALHAGGNFTVAGGASANRIAKWDGTGWTPLGAGTNGEILALLSFDPPGGVRPELFAGGDFTSAFDSEDSHLARWVCPPPPTIHHKTRVR